MNYFSKESNTWNYGLIYITENFTILCDQTQNKETIAISF